MLRTLGKIWAKLSYIFTLEVEAAKADINASVAKRNAETSRKLVAQLTAEADTIEENIKTVAADEDKRRATPEYLSLSKQEQYEDERASKKEKDAALQIVAEKRRLAEQEKENVANRDQVSQTLRGTAANSRAFANKIREL
jgi:hypothetical protein